jgi:hypothetical protein
MNRRSFLEQTTLGAAAFFTGSRAFSTQTKHLVLIVNGGARKKDYYENASLSPNIRRLAAEGFVFEEDHCDTIASHDAAFAEIVNGLEPSYSLVHSIRDVPRALQQLPQIVVCRDMTYEVAHDSYEKYLRVVRATDSAVGTLFDWVTTHSYFGQNTAIAIRPEFGRDDEVNEHGQLHHSEGFYYTHRVATILWGPHIPKGVETAVIRD